MHKQITTVIRFIRNKTCSNHNKYFIGFFKEIRLFYLKETRKTGCASIPKEGQVAESGEEEITGDQNPHLHVEGNHLTGSRHVINQYHQLHPT
jgi:hypothetical protein